MRDPIEHLLEEHKVILAEFEPLRRAVGELERHGEAAVPGSLEALRAVGQMMATRLHRHATKEDEALFPALEAVFGSSGGPTAVMRQEHRDIHAEAERFRNTLHELEQVEHPAIVAGGAKLRAATAEGASARDLRMTAEEVLRLVDAHFAKEEQILFPMARRLLDEAARAEVARKMEAIGVG